MKRWLLLGAFLFAIGGCAAPDKAFVGGVDALWKVIGPEYRAYVSSDPAFVGKEAERQIRLDSATSMDKLIAEAQK